jgi:aspartate carbamoyltransferase
VPLLDVPRDPPFRGKHILSVKQFGRDDLDHTFRVATKMRTVVDVVGSIDLLKGRLLANLFYEPSTRTSASFNAAMKRLGGDVVAINEVRYSSVSKGETLEDTIRTLESYVDVVVMRHPEIGAAQRAASVARKPLINAGDGAGEHPTQALLDLFTVGQELGGIDGKTITMVGDMKYGRTVHSLARLLSLYDVRLRLVSPESLRMPAEVRADLDATGMRYVEQSDLGDCVNHTDVLYVTRVQKERFPDPQDYAAVRGAYVITPETLRTAKEHMIVMHPFPRVDEIDRRLDGDPRAAYFRQISYGLYVRMALLAMVLGRA